MGGSVAGVACLVIYNPIELLKCRAQIKTDTFIRYGPEINKIITEEGFFSLYKGSLAAIGRDVPGWGFYFWAFAWFKDNFNLYEDTSNYTTRQKCWNIFMQAQAGGWSGVLSWLCAYPFDVINTICKCDAGK